MPVKIGQDLVVTLQKITTIKPLSVAGNKPEIANLTERPTFY